MSFWKKQTSPWIAGILLSLTSSLSFANVTEFTLDNQMKVLVKEDHRAPVVVHQVWYRIGSNFEHNGKTGISHMLEHMMFKGTKNLSRASFQKLFQNWVVKKMPLLLPITPPITR